MKTFESYKKIIRNIFPKPVENNITINENWFYDVDINEYWKIILEEEKKHGRAILIEYKDEDDFEMTFAHLYNKFHKKFIGFAKRGN